MDKGVKKVWLEALRSGEYKQINGYLKSDDYFCCLGVLTDLYFKNSGTGDCWVESPMLDSSMAFPLYDDYNLSPEVREWAGIQTDDPILKTNFQGYEMARISLLNDELGLDFNELADLIEEQL